MSGKNPHPPLDRKVSPNWKPVAGLAQRKPGLAFSDWIYHGLICLAGLAVVACGIAAMALLHRPKLAGLLVALGFVTFVRGFPTQAQRNGYIE